MNHSDEIKAKLDVVGIIGEYINLKAAGANFRALCPFHNEKTPSFMVSPEKQIWHCFGCGKGGDLISFVMEIEGLDFIEALKLLAPRAGVVLDTKDFSSSSKKNKLLQILDLSSKYYNFILKSKEKKNEKIEEIRSYLKNRGLDEEAINRWNIGYSLDDYEDLINFLKKKGFSEEDIFLSGMSYKRKQGGYFNRFRDRIMFPINDSNGKTIAFTARINPNSKDDKSMGKYINSPQSEVYDKSRVLFALDKAKMAIREKDHIVLVEGQMDAISSHEAGIENVCAVSGTSLTIPQLNLIKRYTKNIVLAFDQDLGGETATDRGISEALKMGFSLKIAVLEEGKDPDDIIRKDLDNFKKLLSEAKNIIDYYLDRELTDIDVNNISEKNKAVSKILKVLNNMNNKIEQGFWIKKLSEKSNISEMFVREELDKLSGSDYKQEKEKPSVFQVKQESREDKLMENLLSLLLKFNDNSEYVFNNLSPDILFGAYKKFYNSLLIYYNKEGDIDYNKLSLYFSDQSEKEEVECLNKLSLKADFNWSEENFSKEKSRGEVVKTVLELKRNALKESIKNENNRLVQAEKEGDNKLVKDILENLKNLNEELREII
jgi:DNA primase